MLYKATAPHPVGLSWGRILAAGETADIDVIDPHDMALRDAGQLTAVHGAEASGIPPGASAIAVKKSTAKPPLEEN